MSNSPAKIFPLQKITPLEVYEDLKSQNYIDELYTDMMARVKEMPSYKCMKEVAVQHMSDISTVSSEAERQEKKKQIAEIGLLALEIETSLSNIITQSLNKKNVTSMVKNTIIRLGSKKSDVPATSTSADKRGIKRIKTSSFEEGNILSPDKEIWTKIRNPVTGTDDDGSIGNRSDESVSSVHTSDLSSFDDEIVYFSEDEHGEKKEKRLSLKSVNLQSCLKDLSSAKKIKKISQPSKILASPRKPLSVKSVKSNEKVSGNIRPKRIRKPNSKYF